MATARTPRSSQADAIIMGPPETSPAVAAVGWRCYSGRRNAFGVCRPVGTLPVMIGASCLKRTTLSIRWLSRCALSNASFLTRAPAFECVEAPPDRTQLFNQRQTSGSQLSGLSRQRCFRCVFDAGSAAVANFSAGALESRSNETLCPRLCRVAGFLGQRTDIDEHRRFIRFDDEAHVVAFPAVERFGCRAQRARDTYNDADRWIEPLIRFDLEECGMVDVCTARQFVLRPSQGTSSDGDSLSQGHAVGL